MAYQHRQIGYLMIVTIILMSIYYSIITYLTGFDPFVTSVILVVLVIVSSFCFLTVTVDETIVKISFGYGIYSKKFSLQEIKSAKAVRNKWYYGFGIRWWPWKNLLIFNISGLDAVEIQMISGKLYRIGTDEPQKLELAIREKLE